MNYSHARIPKLETKTSEEVFVLFSALNAMGYDEENNKSGMFWIRKKVREKLLKKNWAKKYPKLKKFFKNYHQWHLLNKVLSGNKKSIPNFNDFSNELLIKKIWEDYKNYQLKEAKKLYSLFKKETKNLIKFIGNSKIPVNKIILFFNPLDVYWRGYSFKIRNTGYMVVGPGAGRNGSELIRHELLHILVPHFRIPSKFMSKINKKRLSNMGYSTSSTINREHVIRSLNFLYEAEVLRKNITQTIKSEKRNFPHISEVVELVRQKIKKNQ